MLSHSAMHAFELAEQANSPIFVSAITIVEIAYLVEKGKLPSVSWSILIQSLHSKASAITVQPLTLEIAEVLKLISRDQIPDMPDRIIAATAVHLALPLITRDQKILDSGIETIW